MKLFDIQISTTFSAKDFSVDSLMIKVTIFPMFYCAFLAVDGKRKDKAKMAWKVLKSLLNVFLCPFCTVSHTPYPLNDALNDKIGE